MKDDIFYGNLLGLLRQGKWTLSLEEASALLQIFQEVKKRMDGIKIVETDPIKKKDKK